MTRTIGLLAWLLAVAGCVSAFATQYAGSSSLSPADAFDCAQREVVRLGYTIQDANRDAGLIRSQTATPQAMRMDGTPLLYELTVNIVRGTPTQLSVTAHEKAHADALLAACSGR